ncbi:Mss51-mRNA processing-like protein [Ceratobasidium theobromae]|uniref:Mss51-mRNA processing-like protein n=1 Tax=Ceratobasidium theobromae TaxID=1582974 RepID=A0A5N5QYG5_9AGAM|nr:Mss51-mRNA processing-like protein [Ceratobasidium theobromae]
MQRFSPIARNYPRRVIGRQLFNWARHQLNQPPKTTRPILSQDNLFHPLSQSPIPSLQARAKAVTELAPCPVCLDHHEQRRPVTYECPDCGWPTHCSEFHWKEDTDHTQYCTRLREVNEDEHDIRSGRKMREFELPGQQSYEEAVSFANWDVFWYTRSFNSIDSDRSRRHASKLLTYPVTIASLLHENSGINLRNQRLTPEGLRSMTALRYTLHSESPTGDDDPSSKPPMRIFVIGARAESSLPPHVWEQLTHLFPNTQFHIYMIGPQVSLPAVAIPPPPPKPDPTSTLPSADSDSQQPILFQPPILPQITPVGPTKIRDSAIDYGVPSSTSSVSAQLTITSLRTPYADVHPQFEGTFDPYTDVFFAFCPGFGFPSPTSPSELQISAPGEWGRTVPLILQTKCALFVTGFSPTDVERDVRSLDGVEGVAGEFDWIVTPGENPFGSEKWEVADFDPRVMVKTNWGVWGIRGKRRDVDYANEA